MLILIVQFIIKTKNNNFNSTELAKCVSVIDFNNKKNSEVKFYYKETYTKVYFTFNKNNTITKVITVQIVYTNSRK